ncbi:MAG: ATP-binding cassette domain-containing protein [Candidatus Hydrogenedentes bacterium]|nr:ATP-binding cassette domain-containing protein [Candidatus Hydrogenedentota bacterium]
MIRAEGLRKVYYPSRGGPVEAVRGADFQVADGEVFGLLGPNGAGKTTLLRMLATILTPTSGTCWIDGISAVADPAAIRRRIGFLSGNTKLYGRLTAREVLEYFGRLHGMSDITIRERTETLSEELGMGEFLDRRCDSLSTGQTQKVSIARCLLHRPPVLILDEPTLGLDIMTSRAIINFILAARAEGHSIIFSTHYMTEAELLCDRVGLIYQGDLLAVDTKSALYEQTGTRNLQDAFLALVEGEQRNADAAAHH